MSNTFLSHLILDSCSNVGILILMSDIKKYIGSVLKVIKTPFYNKQMNKRRDFGKAWYNFSLFRISIT